MIIIGGGFSEENLKRIAAKVKRSHHNPMDVNAFCHRIDEIFGKLGGRKNKEISAVKPRILTPDQQIQAEILHQRVHAILNQPDKNWNLF